MKPQFYSVSQSLERLVVILLGCLGMPIICGAATFVSFQENDMRTNSDPYTVNTSGTLIINSNGTNSYNMGATYLRKSVPNTVKDGTQLLIGQNAADTYRSFFAIDVSYLTNIVGVNTSRVDSAALVLTHNGNGSGGSMDASVYLTNPFDERYATWNNPYRTSLGDLTTNSVGGIIGAELKRVPVTGAITPGSITGIKEIWGSPSLLWPSTYSAPDSLVGAVRTALASTNKTVYFLLKTITESTTLFARFTDDAGAVLGDTVDMRPELRVGIDSAGMAGNTVGVVATVPLMRQSDSANPGKFSIIRTGDTNSTITVNFLFSGTAFESVHYNWSPFINPPTVTFAPGQTNVEVDITPISTDPTSGPDRTVILTSQPLTGYTLLPNPATVNILPDALVEYAFNENNNNTNLTLSAIATGTVVVAISGQVTANNVVAGSGMGAFGDTTPGVASHYYLAVGGEFTSSPSSFGCRGNVLTNNQAGAIADNDYLSFTIAPKPGAALNYSGMGFQVKVSVTYATANMFLRSSLDNFASDLGAFSKTGNGAFSFITTSLSDPGFTQALAPIEFRLYFYSSDITNASQALRLDDVVFYGNPATLPAGIQQLTVAATGNAAEPNVAGSFTLTRGGDVSSPLAVNYALGGTATNGVHYQLLSGTTNFAAAQSSIVIPVVPIDNSTYDPGKTVVLTLASNAAYTLIFNSATVLITNDDAPVVTQPVITTTSVVGTGVTIDFTGAASDPASAFKLYRCATADGTYAEDTGASITALGGAQFRATTVTNGAAQFYRIRR